MVRFLEDEDFLNEKVKEVEEFCAVKFNGSGPFDKISFVKRNWKQLQQEFDAIVDEN